MRNLSKLLISMLGLFCLPVAAIGQSGKNTALKPQFQTSDR